MKNHLSVWLVGFIFAFGLGISGMTQPQKVIGFLDVLGNWDPSLLFVMVGAIFVHAVSYRLIKKRRSPLFSTEWRIPKNTDITPNLMFGSLIFGIGWGLAGYCPGPAVTSLASFQVQPALFVLGMIGGMFVFTIISRRQKTKA